MVSVGLVLLAVAAVAQGRPRDLKHTSRRLVEEVASFELHFNTARGSPQVVDRYDRRVIPLAGPDFRPINVSFRLNLYQLLEFLVVNAWIMERWEDSFLAWDPGRYDGISSIILPHSAIWLPNTILYNSLTMKDEESRRLLNVQLRQANHTTTAELLYPAIFTFSCRLNILFFPFDQQNCSLIFGSWTHDTSTMDYFLTSDKVGMASYIPNEGWSVVDFYGVRLSHNYSCCPFPYTNLHYHLIIQRKPLFYIVNLVIPTAIITFISLVGFFMPSAANGERTEKISLGITTLLSMSILLLMVSDQMPTTSNFIPLIGWFYLSMIGLISSGTIATSLVIIVQRQGRRGREMGERARGLGRLLARLTLSAVPDAPVLPRSDAQRNGRSRRDSLGGAQWEAGPKGDGAWPAEEAALGGLAGLGPGGRAVAELSVRLRAIGRTLETVGEGLGRREWRGRRREEWEWLATVVERAALLAFLSTQILITSAILALGYSRSNTQHIS